MAKRRCCVTPICALILALGAIWGVSLWWYDRYNHARTLREIHAIAGFADQLRIAKKVINA